MSQTSPTPPEPRAGDLYLGVEIGGTKLQVVAGDAGGRIVGRWRADAARDEGGPGIARQIGLGLRQMLAGGQFRAVGAGFGGPVDVRAGRIHRSHQIAGWENFELKNWIEQETGLPAVVENDSNLAALAEATCGAAAGQSPVFYFNLGSGVGAGVVIDGAVYHGAPPGEAEFGHVRLDRSGNTVESRCSGWAIDRRLRASAEAHPHGILASLLPREHGGEARKLSAALERQDPDACRILDELAGDLAFALSHAIHLFHPQVVVVGGGLSLIGTPLRDALADALPRHLMGAFAPGPPVRLTALGEDGVPAGALILAARAAST